MNPPDSKHLEGTLKLTVNKEKSKAVSVFAILLDCIESDYPSLIKCEKINITLP